MNHLVLHSFLPPVGKGEQPAGDVLPSCIPTRDSVRLVFWRGSTLIPVPCVSPPLFCPQLPRGRRSLPPSSFLRQHSLVCAVAPSVWPSSPPFHRPSAIPDILETEATELPRKYSTEQPEPCEYVRLKGQVLTDRDLKPSFL